MMIFKLQGHAKEEGSRCPETSRYLGLWARDERLLDAQGHGRRSGLLAPDSIGDDTQALETALHGDGVEHPHTPRGSSIEH